MSIYLNIQGTYTLEKYDIRAAAYDQDHAFKFTRTPSSCLYHLEYSLAIAMKEVVPIEWLM